MTEPTPAEAGPAAREDEHERRMLRRSLAVLIVVGAFLAGDLAVDYAAGVGPTHLRIQIGAFLLAIAGIVGMAIRLRAAVFRSCELRRALHGTRLELARSRGDAEALRRRVGNAMDAHFARWALDRAEREVALLVLRGLSYKAIARACGTPEQAVRRRALGIYRKAGVAGRAEMAALFLEEMLLGAGGAGQATRAASASGARTAPEPRATPTPLPAPSRRTPAGGS